MAEAGGRQVEVEMDSRMLDVGGRGVEVVEMEVDCRMLGAGGRCAAAGDR